MNRFVFRQERFGALVYDRKTHGLSIEPRRHVRADADADAVLSAPLRVFLIITRACNLSCSYCSTRSGHGRTDRMSYDFIDGLLTGLTNMGVFEVAINGGEPLVHPDFFRVIERARALGLCTYLNTNGVMSDSQLQRLAGAGVDRIKISIDGLSAGNDEYRGTGSFARAMHSARYLSATGNHVRINAVLSRRTAPDMVELARLCEEYGCGLKIAPVVRVGRGHELTEERFTATELRTIAEELARYCGNATGQHHIEFCQALIEEQIRGGPPLDCHGKSLQQHLSCCNGYMHATIDTDGSVYGTGQQVDLEGLRPAGNAYTESLEEIWEKLTVRADATRSADPVCQGCDFESNLVDVIRNIGARFGEVWQSDMVKIPFGPAPCDCCWPRQSAI